MQDSIVPRPCPVFRHLQYGKVVEDFLSVHREGLGTRLGARQGQHKPSVLGSILSGKFLHLGTYVQNMYVIMLDNAI